MRQIGSEETQRLQPWPESFVGATSDCWSYLESVNSCFSIHSEKPTTKINVPIADRSAMKDITFLLPEIQIEQANNENVVILAQTIGHASPHRGILDFDARLQWLEKRDGDSAHPRRIGFT